MSGEQISPEQALYLLRRQRHSFLNHMQVISGWLQLDRPERARLYLEAVSTRMVGESDVLRNASAALGMAVLELGLEAETHGVQLEWQTAGALSAFPDAILPRLREELLQAMAEAPGQPQDDRRLIIRLMPESYTVHSASGKGEG
jgi:hypothetical protein